MSQVKKNASPRGDMVIADGEELNLQNRYLAAFLAWLVPGAGHYYQRRYLKSAIFFVSIVSTFIIGMCLAGGKCVYASWNSTEVRWQFVLQSGVGLPALPAALEGWRASKRLPPLTNFMNAPSSTADLDQWNFDTASGFDMGTLYTMIAGLLNVLVIFDAYAGPLPPPVPKKSERKRSNNDPGDGTAPTPSAPTATEKT